MLAAYRRIATVVTARQLDELASRDADDDAVLGCALAARADLVVSGDDDLLVLASFKAIAICRPPKPSGRWKQRARRDARSGAMAARNTLADSGRPVKRKQNFRRLRCHSSAAPAAP